MTKLLRSLVFACFLVGLVVGRVEAQATVGGAVAWHDEADLGIAGFVSMPLSGVHPNLSVVGDFSWFFPDDEGTDADVDYYEVNGNLLYGFPSDGPVNPWVLAGVNIARASAEAGDVSVSDTEVGLNVGGGVTFATESIRPLAGAKYELGGGEGFVVFAGIGIPLGG